MSLPRPKPVLPKGPDRAGRAAPRREVRPGEGVKVGQTLPLPGLEGLFSLRSLGDVRELALSTPEEPCPEGTVWEPIRVKQVLNRSASARLPFYYTLNPYRGCQHGCVYCFARYSHAWLGMDDPLAFERRVFVKVNAAEVLARTVRDDMLRGRPVALGTVTDPWQPAERRYGVTRGLLEVLTRFPSLTLQTVTRGHLITRDLDLLQEIQAKCQGLVISISLITLKKELSQRLDPYAPLPHVRLKTLETLSRAGLQVGVFVMPILPGINDREAELDALLGEVQARGGQYAAHQVLNLRCAPSRQRFQPVLAEGWPGLVAAYARGYGRASDAPEDYRARVKERFYRLREKHGLAGMDEERCELPEAAQGETAAGAVGQLELG